MHRIIAYCYPNNEIRVRLCPTPSVKNLLREENPLAVDEPSGDSCMNSQTSNIEDSDSQASDLTLDISSELRTHPSPNLPPGFGGTPKRTVFGLNARRTILRCGGVLDTEEATKQTLMLTGTLPGSTEESMREMANWSSYFVDRLKSWIAKKAKATYSMYTWELQKRGALHIHYVVNIPDDESRNAILNGFKAQWYRLLENVTEKTGVDMFQRASGGTWRNTPEKLQARAEECKFSVAGYISKYISKRESKHKNDYCPVRWWGCSRPLLARLKEMTEEVEIDKLTRGKAELIYQNLLYALTTESLSSYEYRDKVGQGKNLVTFHPKNLLEQTWHNVLSEKPTMTRKTTDTYQHKLMLLRQVSRLLTNDSRIWNALEKTLSQSAKVTVLKSCGSQLMSLLELETTIEEVNCTLRWRVLNGQYLSESLKSWMNQSGTKEVSRNTENVSVMTPVKTSLEISHSRECKPIAHCSENIQLSLLAGGNYESQSVSTSSLGH